MSIIDKIKKKRSSEVMEWYALIIIPIIGFLIFKLYPIIWTVSKAWYFYDGSISTSRFVGMENFLNLFKDKTYWNSWLVTLKFAVFKLPIELPLAMIMAVLLNKKLKGTSIFRGIYYMPNILSMAVIGVIFSGMFDYFGYINGVIKSIGFNPVNWFSNAGTALMVLVIASVWNTFGVNAMYFLAALHKFRPFHHNDASAAKAFDFDVRANADHLPAVAAAGMGLARLNDVAQTNFFHAVRTSGMMMKELYNLTGKVSTHPPRQSLGPV